MYGKILAEALSDRVAYEADDQSSLVYLLLTQGGRWKEKTFLETSYYLHGFWLEIVDRYEEMRRKWAPGLGDDRWPLVTHFVGCKPCEGLYASYDASLCRRGMERALNFADDQILKMYGCEHESLNATTLWRIRNDTGGPLDAGARPALAPSVKGAFSWRAILDGMAQF
jgi:xyloglucan 6-xylosyltransferase